MKRKEEDIRKEYAASSEDLEKRGLLIKVLAALQQKQIHPEESLKATQKVYVDIFRALEEILGAQLPPDQIKQAKKAIAEGDPALAESLLNEVVTSGMQQSAEASYQLGLLAQDRVDYEAAWKALTRAAELAPDNSLYLNEVGMMAHTLGRYDIAIQYFEKALAIDLETRGPEHPDIAIRWNNLGAAWKTKGEVRKAREYYSKALVVFRKAGLEHRATEVEENIQTLPPA